MGCIPWEALSGVISPGVEVASKRVRVGLVGWDGDGDAVHALISIIPNMEAVNTPIRNMDVGLLKRQIFYSIFGYTLSEYRQFGLVAWEPYGLVLE
jgi:hypothetical protein